MKTEILAEAVHIWLTINNVESAELTVADSTAFRRTYRGLFNSGADFLDASEARGESLTGAIDSGLINIYPSSLTVDGVVQVHCFINPQ
jgi:hypothetical protein